MPDRFEGKVVVITGAAGGIGRATAVRFASEGARILAVDLPHSELDETVAAVQRVGGQVAIYEADVTVASQVESYVQAALDQSGQIDVFFNNAGIEGWVGSLLDYPEDEFDRVFAVNVKGVFLGLQAVGRAMQQAGGGAIINTASVAGLQATASAAAYGASKSAVVGLTKSAAIAFVDDGIRVNAICPGPIETRMMRAMERGVNPDDPEAVHRNLSASTPMKRYGEAEEIAAMVAFLASDDASYITGGIYPVDGGTRAN